MGMIVTWLVWVEIGYGKIFNNANLKDLFKKNRMIVNQKVHKIVM